VCASVVRIGVGKGLGGTDVARRDGDREERLGSASGKTKQREQTTRPLAQEIQTGRR